MLQNRNGRNFVTPYVFVEYPKWVELVDGSKMLVNNKAEENILTATLDDELESQEDGAEREALVREGKELGLVIHPATKIDKLRAKVEAARVS